MTPAAALPRTVLLVDDEPDVLRSLGRFFQRTGWEVLQAATGEDALRVWELHRPDLVLLDLVLPGISGLEVLEVLVPQDAVVLMLTGHGDIESAVEAMRLGAETFIAKPVELSHLEAVANRAFEPGSCTGMMKMTRA